MKKLDWKSYEELVKYIYEQLGKASNVKIIGYGSSCKCEGKSGVEHQIDVLTSHNDGLHDYLTDIECKFWNEKVTKDTVMKVEAIVKDCNFSKGIIVSKIGFTEDAIKYAQHIGVGLVELREITDEDWKGRVQTIIINIIAVEPILTGCCIDVVDNSRKSGDAKMMTANAQEVIITYPSGETRTLSEFIRDEFFVKLHKEEPETVLKEKYTFDQNTTISYSKDDALQLRYITLEGTIAKDSIQSVIDGKDEVLYYMRCIFEGTVLTIRKDGRIVKQD